MPGQLPQRLDNLRRSFWFLPAVGIGLGVVLGFVLVELDYELDVDESVFTFVDLQSARSVLETIATVTVSVAGLAFSVTVVALQLASQQLSPRVLRTFQNDRLSQTVLAMFVGTFVYSLVVLAKLTEEGVPAIAVTVAIVCAIAAFGLFVAFIHHIVVTLKASTLIHRIGHDGRRAIESQWPKGAGDEPRDLAEARASVERRVREPETRVRAPRAGFVTAIRGRELVELGAEEDLVVIQRIAVGEFALTGSLLASVHGAPAGRGEELCGRVRDAFSFGNERSVVGDAGYPVRQLADVALRGLSPSLNDPTTAENAIDTIAELLVRFVRTERPSEVRVDAEGVPRLVAMPVGLDDLVRTGFEQVREAASGQHVVARHVISRLGELASVAEDHGHDGGELRRQARLTAAAAQRNAVDDADGADVRAALERAGIG